MEANLNPEITQGKLEGNKLNIAIIESRWNELVTSRLTAGAIESLASLGVVRDAIQIFKVPGAFELPITAQKVAESNQFDALICIGVVIKGETPHFDFVAGEAAKGISRVGLETGIPVVFCVLTTETVDQAFNRAGMKFGNKGIEAAQNAVEMANLFAEIEGKVKSSNNRKAMP